MGEGVEESRDTVDWSKYKKQYHKRGVYIGKS